MTKDQELIRVRASNRELITQLRELSDAYLRIRQIIGKPAYDTPNAPSPAMVWETTEFALKVALGQEP